MKKPIILILAAAIGLGAASLAGAAGSPRAVSCPPGNSNPAYCTTTPDTTTTQPTTSTPAPTPPPSSNGQPPTVIAGGDGKTVDITYSCPSTATSHCVGTLILRADDGTRSVRARAHIARVVEIGRAPYDIAPGQSATIKVTLSSDGQRLLASKRSIKVNAFALPQGSTTEIPAGTVSIESAKSSTRCVSRRHFTIHVFQPLGASHIVSARVMFRGKQIRLVKGRSLRATIDMRGLKSGTYTVIVTGRTKHGRTVRETRRYRTCRTPSGKAI